MPFSPLKFGLNKDYPFEQIADLPGPTDLKSHYDVVIIGGGGHGLHRLGTPRYGRGR